MNGFDLRDVFSLILAAPFVVLFLVEVGPVLLGTKYKPEDLITYK